MMSREKRSFGEAGYGYSGYKRLLKVPTPVFVIPGLILFVVGMLLVILIWSPLNLWKTGLGANSMMAGFLFAFGGLLMVVLGLAVRIDGVQNEQLNYDFTKVSEYIVKRVSLERGATAQTLRKFNQNASQLVIFLAGFVYAIHLILVWVESGYKDLPTFEHEFAGITLLVIGLQMIIQTLGKFNQNASLFALSQFYKQRSGRMLKNAKCKKQNGKWKCYGRGNEE